MTNTQNMHNEIFETANRKLENFLYVHDIQALGFHKNDDGLTVWEYARTPELMETVEEFREIQKRRQMRLRLNAQPRQERRAM